MSFSSKSFLWSQLEYLTWVAKPELSRELTHWLLDSTLLLSEVKSMWNMLQREERSKMEKILEFQTTLWRERIEIFD